MIGENCDRKTMTEENYDRNRLNDLVTNGFAELKTNADRRDHQIDRLVGIVETLIQRDNG